MLINLHDNKRLSALRSRRHRTSPPPRISVLPPVITIAQICPLVRVSVYSYSLRGLLFRDFIGTIRDYQLLLSVF